VRLFVALDFPAAIRDAIGELVLRLKSRAKDVRWVGAEKMHVTLKFIGHVQAEQLEPIVRALSAIHLNLPVEMRFRGVGFFPTERRPSVIWCGIDASPNLPELAAQIERALLPLGIPAEGREFTPHLTLGRLDSPHGLGQLVEMAHEIESLDLGTTRQRQFHLFESALKRSGAEYTMLRSFPFAKEPA
jgi:RNA 2',3'-cyclic 3'-phosphodiesterase